ncbi:MAG: hypothetical protein PHW50_03545 [Patescibacteria group bacterium]|nr:hypothetical protein [Patescibacteria group bacterium]
MKKWLIRFKQEKFKGKVKMLGPIFVLLLAIGATFYLSFQYFFLADFPIGQDVLYHMNRVLRVESEGFFKAFDFSIYPLSVIMLVFWHKFLAFFGLGIERSFIFAECFYLFLISILTGVVSYKVFKDWRVAVVAMILVASSRWINDYLRIGLMAELLGLVFFMLALFFLLEKRWFLLVVTIILLFLSHPLPFFVFLATLSIIVFFWIFSKKGGKWRVILFVILMLTLGVGTVYLFWPQYIRTVLYYFHYYLGQRDERAFFHYMIDYDKRRLIFYALGFLGIVWSLVKAKKSQKFWSFLIFAVLSISICFKQYLGIHYLSFRFYAYFEIAMAVFGAFAVVHLSNTFRKWPLILLSVLLLIFIAVYPNYWTNKDITNWQLSDYAAGHVLPLPERNNTKEIEAKINRKYVIYSNSVWVLWFKTDGFLVRQYWNYGNKFSLYKIKNDDEWLSFFSKNNIGYVYFSSIEPLAEIEKSQILQLIFDKENIRLYEIKF